MSFIIIVISGVCGEGCIILVFSRNYARMVLVLGLLLVLVTFVCRFCEGVTGDAS